jgi:hypothetical protein
MTEMAGKVDGFVRIKHVNGRCEDMASIGRQAASVA